MPAVFRHSGRAAAAALVVLGLSAPGAAARILSVEPASGLPGMIVAAPPRAEDGEIASATHMLGFDERQEVVLRAPVETDQGVIPAGTRVSSHMILFNLPDGQAGARAENVWTLSGPVIGVMSDAAGAREAASSPALGAPGTAYPPAGYPNRGVEMNDRYQGIGTRHLRVRMYVWQPGDWIRVITGDQPVAAPVRRIEEAKRAD